MPDGADVCGDQSLNQTDIPNKDPHSGLKRASLKLAMGCRVVRSWVMLTKFSHALGCKRRENAAQFDKVCP